MGVARSVLNYGRTILRFALPPAMSRHFMEAISTEGTSLSSATSIAMPQLFEAVSPSMKAVEAVVRELAHSSVPVLLLGERGTGKRTIAQRIHAASDRPQHEFLDV